MKPDEAEELEVGEQSERKRHSEPQSLLHLPHRMESGQLRR